MSLTQLLTEPRLREIGDLAQEIMDKCVELQDALASYEGTADMSKSEKSVERADIRDQVVATMAEISSDLRVFDKLHQQFEAEAP